MLPIPLPKFRLPWQLPEPSKERTEPLSPLERLLPELILELTDHLDPVSTLCLKRASRSLYNLVPCPPNPGQCAQFRLMSLLERDLVNPSKGVLCGICKKRHPRRAFTDWRRPEESLTRQMLVKQPATRICQKRFYRCINFSWLKHEDKWQAELKQFCMHCGNVPDWRLCRCTCEFCEKVEMEVYVRHIKRGSIIRRWFFQYQSDGRLIVVEKYTRAQRKLPEHHGWFNWFDEMEVHGAARRASCRA
ncbi:MAG: hypothetical protein M1829_006771 [Trizodia sp. TS-e1964]|nr:MAG: hypothetical protein M1829_006771 [Trizodia sp. TS-e1964]